MPSVEAPAFILPCVVCEADVILASDAPAEAREHPLCLIHYFFEDPTEAWEAGDE